MATAAVVSMLPLILLLILATVTACYYADAQFGTFTPANTTVACAVSAATKKTYFTFDALKQQQSQCWPSHAYAIILMHKFSYIIYDYHEMTRQLFCQFSKFTITT